MHGVLGFEEGAGGERRAIASRQCHLLLLLLLLGGGVGKRHVVKRGRLVLGGHQPHLYGVRVTRQYRPAWPDLTV